MCVSIYIYIYVMYPNSSVRLSGIQWLCAQIPLEPTLCSYISNEYHMHHSATLMWLSVQFFD